MIRHTRVSRERVQKAMGGARNTVRAEQMRAVGLSERVIARRLEIPVEALCRWFALQDELVLDDVDGAA